MKGGKGSKVTSKRLRGVDFSSWGLGDYRGGVGRGCDNGKKQRGR